MVFTPLTVLMLPAHVPSGVGLPILSMRALETKFNTLPVSKRHEVRMVWSQASLSSTSDTHCMCALSLWGVFCELNAFTMSLQEIHLYNAY